MKRILFAVLCTLCCVSLSANVVTGVAAVPANYYDDVDGKTGAESILNALKTCISRNYNEISYKALESHYLNTDFYADTLWDVYSTCRFTYDDANNPQKYVCDGWNKEHVCCQSWLGSGPMVSDMFNVYPTDARVNNLRSNYPYGVVGTNKGISGDPDHHALGKLGTSSKAGYSGTCYEPDDQYKGDLARTFFYMVARYRTNVLNSGYGSNMFTSNPTNLTSYSLSFLLEWHRNDPVSQKEIDRNQGVYGEQNNRNPFIDYPELVEYIWGTKVGQTVSLSSMTPTCEGGGYTPATNAKFGVNWYADGVLLRTDSVAANNVPATLPAAPVSCSETSESFVGWSSTVIEGTTQDAPTCYTKVAALPAVTHDISYHAVFAHAEVTQGAAVPVTQTINMKAQGYGNGDAVTTVTQEDVTITFGKGTAGSNVPKYYNTGEAVRCYPGNTMTVSAQAMTQIYLIFGSGDGTNPITVDTGTLSGSTWTGNADNVTFTVGGSSSNRRFAEVQVTMNGSGDVITYSDYLTHCTQVTEAVTQPVTPKTAQKILRDGQLLIRVNNMLYNIMGYQIGQ
jgi:endonuclease I